MCPLNPAGAENESAAKDPSGNVWLNDWGIPRRSNIFEKVRGETIAPPASFREL